MHYFFKKKIGSSLSFLSFLSYQGSFAFAEKMTRSKLQLLLSFSSQEKRGVIFSFFLNFFNKLYPQEPMTDSATFRAFVKQSEYFDFVFIAAVSGPEFEELATQIVIQDVGSLERKDRNEMVERVCGSFDKVCQAAHVYFSFFNSSTISPTLKWTLKNKLSLHKQGVCFFLNSRKIANALNHLFYSYITRFLSSSVCTITTLIIQ